MLRMAAGAAAFGVLAVSAAVAQESPGAGNGALDQRQARAAAPAWGTSGTTYYTVGAAEFLPKDSITGWGTFVSPSGRYATNSGAVARWRSSSPRRLV